MKPPASSVCCVQAPNDAMKKARCAAFWSMIIEGFFMLIITASIFSGTGGSAGDHYDAHAGHDHGRLLRGSPDDAATLAFEPLQAVAPTYYDNVMDHVREAVGAEGVAHAHRRLSGWMGAQWYQYLWWASTIVCFVVACLLICPCCKKSEDPSTYTKLMMVNLAGAGIHGYPWINFLVVIGDYVSISDFITSLPHGLGYIIFGSMTGLLASRVCCAFFGMQASKSSVGTAV